MLYDYFMKDHYINEQRVLLTEQDPKFNKLSSLQELAYDAIGISLPGDFLDEMLNYIAVELPILKLYTAARFNDVLKYMTRHGIPAPEASTLRKEYFSHLSKAVSSEEIAALSKQLIQDIGKCLNSYDISHYSHNIRLAIQYIHSMRFQPLHPNDIAEYLHINRSYLSSRFHKEVGVTLTEYIHQMKLDLAEQLMDSSAYSLTEIADLLGYSSYGYFSKIYKKYRGKLPEKNNKKTEV